MSRAIVINKLKNINYMKFDMPPQGVWLLTARNGGGKTSLLACVRRIKESFAFQTHFPASQESEQIDNYSKSSVSYVIDDEEVTYSYGGSRWVPRPRANSGLLGRFGYPEMIYIGATADRVTPRTEDFRPRRIKDAHREIITAANQIFDTKKFSDLKFINLTVGTGNIAFLIKKGEKNFHSEKQFSLGELCVIKLVDKIRECSDNSIIIIDELEMALHPQAQLRLYDYLVMIAKRKKLTVIFSTHSVSLINYAKRSNIIYLEKDDTGNISPIYGCFPAYAVGELAGGADVRPDAVFYVEDELARDLLEPIFANIVAEAFYTKNIFVNYRITPIGPADAVVRFLTEHSGLISEVECCAILDKDILDETLDAWKKEQSQKKIAVYNSVKDKIEFMPWTPEVGICDYLQRSKRSAENYLRTKLHVGINIDISLFAEYAASNGSNRRKKAKEAFRLVVASLVKSSAINKSAAEAALINCFSEAALTMHRDKFKNILLKRLKA